MQPQKLCLKWNSHTSNLLSVLGDFQQKDILVDVTISCEGHNIKAHKMILSACSPYFQGIFMENPCQHPVVIMNGMKYEDITAILSFMYKGEVNVSHDGLQSFLHAAETLKVKGLAEVYENEKKSTNSSGQDVQQSENNPQRTDTPPSRRRHRNRKRSLSDSNRSDDEGSSRKQLREPSSPEVHELSGDESFTGDTNSNGPPFNSTPRVPQNMYSRAHQSSSNLADDDDDFEVEPSKLLEQTLTTENVSMSNSSTDKQLRIERIMGNATEIESSSLQEPESPPDIKPIIDYGDSNAGPSDGTMMLYNDQSQPGPSNLQDGSILHDNSHAQGINPILPRRPALHMAPEVISSWSEHPLLLNDSNFQNNRILTYIIKQEAMPECPADTSVKLPADVPAKLLSDVPVKLPADVPAKLPADMPSKLPADIPSKLPADMPLELSADILSELPADIPSELRADISSELPADIPSELPADIPENLPADLPVKLPANTNEDFTALDKYLEDVQNFDIMIEYMSRHGGRTVVNAVNNNLRRLMTNKLAMSYNYKGTRGKNSIEITNINTLLIRSVKKSNGASARDIIAAIKVWLKHAPQRFAMSKKRYHSRSKGKR